MTRHVLCWLEQHISTFTREHLTFAPFKLQSAYGTSRTCWVSCTSRSFSHSLIVGRRGWVPAPIFQEAGQALWIGCSSVVQWCLSPGLVLHQTLEDQVFSCLFNAIRVGMSSQVLASDARFFLIVSCSSCERNNSWGCSGGVWLFCPFAISPPGWFVPWHFCPLALLPPGFFAAGLFALWLIHPRTMDDSSPGSFASWLVHPLADSSPYLGRFAPIV